ncbi:MAG: MFS transporter [Verrucomicrobiota bacterium]
MSVPVSDKLVPGGNIRWWLCGLLFAATALSFLDRQVLSVLAPVVTRQLGMSNLEYSHATNAYLISYAVMFLLSGRMLDVLGTRFGMMLCVGLWSLASAAHSLIQNAMQLGIARFLLGAGEGGCFPGAAKGVTEWFPRQERALAMGLAIGGASLGAVLAPPLTIWVSQLLGWRSVFLVTGMLGIAWVIAWWYSSSVLSKPQSLSASTSNYRRPVKLSLLFTRLDFWGLAMVRLMVDPVFYFYNFWIPKYLSQERGASQQEIGELSWIPFLALGFSNIFGGWLSDHLVRKGFDALVARRWIMAGAAVLTMASSLTGKVGSVTAALAMMALLMLAHGFWVTNYITLISERFPQNAIGTVTGFSGAIGALGGILANTTIGWVVDHFSYGPVWLASGFMYPLAFGVLLLTVKSCGAIPKDAGQMI